MFFFNWGHFFQIWGNGGKCVSGILKFVFNWGVFFLKIGGIFFKLGAMGANVLVQFEKKILTGGIFLKLGAKNYFGIKKISFFGNYIDPPRR